MNVWDPERVVDAGTARQLLRDQFPDLALDTIEPLGEFYHAEGYHQQYLDKNPGGYCPNHATGVKLPDDFVVTPLQYAD